LGPTVNTILYDGIFGGWNADPRVIPGFGMSFPPVGLWFLVTQTLLQSLLLGLYMLLDYGKPAKGPHRRPLCAYVGASLAVLLFTGCSISHEFCPWCMEQDWAQAHADECASHPFLTLVSAEFGNLPPDVGISKLTSIPLYATSFFLYPLLLPRSWPSVQPTIFGTLRSVADLAGMPSWPCASSLAMRMQPFAYACFWLATLGSLMGLLYLKYYAMGAPVLEKTACCALLENDRSYPWDLFTILPTIFAFAALMPTKWTVFASMGAYSLFIFVLQSATRSVNTEAIIAVGTTFSSPFVAALFANLALVPLFFLITIYPITTVWRWLTPLFTGLCQSCHVCAYR